MAVIIPYVNHVSVNCICSRYNIIYVPKASVNNPPPPKRKKPPDSLTVVNTDFLKIVKFNIIDLSIIWGHALA